MQISRSVTTPTTLPSTPTTGRNPRFPSTSIPSPSQDCSRAGRNMVFPSLGPRLLWHYSFLRSFFDLPSGGKDPRITSTEHGVCSAACSETLPSVNRSNSRRPCEPTITIRTPALRFLDDFSCIALTRKQSVGPRAWDKIYEGHHDPGFSLRHGGVTQSDAPAASAKPLESKQAKRLAVSVLLQVRPRGSKALPFLAIIWSVFRVEEGTASCCDGSPAEAAGASKPMGAARSLRAGLLSPPC